MSLTNSQIDEIMREYSRIQIANNNRSRTRFDEVVGKVYEMTGESLVDIRDEKISLHKSKLFADEETIKKADAAIEILRQKEAMLIEQAGFTPDYLEPIYNCPLCKDTGYVDGEKCACFKKACIELLYKSTNNLNLSKDHTFDRFDCTVYSREKDEIYGITPFENAKNILTFAKGFVKDFDSKPRNVFLFGNVGTGKTFLADCIANGLINTLHSVIYMSAHDFFENMAQSEFNKTEDITSNVKAESIYDCDLLIIDDLGTETTNSFSQSILFNCINERILRKKSTIITSNYNLNQIRDIYSERISSRIYGNYTLIPILGDDLRVQK